MFFTPVKIGPITLRNRSIRAAAFEGMCQNHKVTPQLVNYHEEVAKGGIGMTTVAYAAVEKSGLSFKHQLLIEENNLPDLTNLVNKIHQHNAKASIQLGHCGNMAKRNVIGRRPISSSTHINLYAPSFPKKMSHKEINETVKAFGDSVRMVKKAGFDAVEIHAGHGYLISQFLSPYRNKRKDEYGGSLENRMRFMELVMREVLDAANNEIAVLVKMNMTDGFKGGITLDESIIIAKKLEEIGVHALVLSSGFVSKAPMEVMRGVMPIKTLAAHAGNKVLGVFMRLFGKMMVPSVPFKETYFLENAKKFRASLKLPLVYVGGILSKENIDNVLNENFEAVAIARALIKDPDFVNKLKLEEYKRSSCDTCNHCIAVMYDGPFECIQNS